jgi:hypothetical protein
MRMVQNNQGAAVSKPLERNFVLLLVLVRGLDEFVDSDDENEGEDDLSMQGARSSVAGVVYPVYE